MDKIFQPANILLPKACDMEKWSVIACDQFSSQREYWDELDHYIGSAPSTLRLMFPEAYIGLRDQLTEAGIIDRCMHDYLRDGVFQELRDVYVYVERTLADGTVRRGVIGVLDLEQYDYAASSSSPIRATEGTVEERLPPRVRIRENAELEMPHIIVFIDDAGDTVMGSLEAEKNALEKLYDFELNAHGGHIKGWKVGAAQAGGLESAIEALSDEKTLRDRYDGAAPAIFAMGDGNHSLATAKKCWEQLKPTLSPEERKNHPARYGLVEIENIHDKAVTFEPIHRVIFDTDATDFLAEAKDFWTGKSKGAGDFHTVHLLSAGERITVDVCGMTIGQIVGAAEEFCQSYVQKQGGRIDYIHNDDTATEMATRKGCGAILLPKMEKRELFPSIIKSGPFPKKSFSIGHAQDKRYYLECRKIK